MTMGTPSPHLALACLNPWFYISQCSNIKVLILPGKFEAIGRSFGVQTRVNGMVLIELGRMMLSYLERN